MAKMKLKPTLSSASQTEASEQERMGLKRLVFFSDAVFAIAITLLALEIRLPSGEVFSNAQLSAKLLSIWPKYFAYAISFLTIGNFWGAHLRKFSWIKRYDTGLLMLNLVLLMTIAFIPFPTSLISEYGNRTATIFYASNMILVSLFSAALWWHAARHNHLTDPQLNAQRRRRELSAPLVMAAIFGLTIGFSFINDDLAKLTWLLILPASIRANRVKKSLPQVAK